NSGLPANRFADEKRPLKKDVGDFAGGSPLVRELIGVLDLAQNFRLSNDQRIQAGGHAKQMADGVAGIKAVQRGIQLGRAVELMENLAQSARRSGRRTF